LVIFCFYLDVVEMFILVSWGKRIDYFQDLCSVLLTKKNQKLLLFFLSFHNIFRLRLVLTPVSTSGKKGRVPFNGTLPKNPASGIGTVGPLSTLICRVPVIKDNTQNGKGELGLLLCVPPSYILFCMQSSCSMSEFFHFLAWYFYIHFGCILGI
jgi:hypothetical protein